MIAHDLHKLLKDEFRNGSVDLVTQQSGHVVRKWIEERQIRV